MNEKNSKNASDVNSFDGKLRTHNFSDEDLKSFRKEGLIEIATETAINPEKLFENRYPSEELVVEGIDLYRNWIEDSEEFLKSNTYRIFQSDKKYRDWVKNGAKPPAPEMFIPFLSIDGGLFKSRSISNFKKKTIKQLEKLERNLDNSSFSGKKYGFIDGMINKVNGETPDSFKGSIGQLTRNLTEEEEKIYNFKNLDRDLSDYVFKNKHDC